MPGRHLRAARGRGGEGLGGRLGGRHRGVLVTAVDQKSKFTALQAVAGKTRDLVGGALVAMREPLKDVAPTVTDDSGREFAGHREVSEVLGAAVYFARPYHSSERGLTAHTNGWVRQYFGKSGSCSDSTSPGPSRTCSTAGRARRLDSPPHRRCSRKPTPPVARESH